MWAAMNFVKLLRGIRMLSLSPPLNTWKRLQTRSLNLSETFAGQRNAVQAGLGRGTSASDAACAERCFLYRSIWYMTVATGNVSRRVEIIDGFVVPAMLVLRLRHLHHN